MRTKSLWPEILIVMGLSLGQSAIYAVISLIDKLSRGPLGSQTTTLNNSLSNRQYFDLTYQLMDIMFALVPVALVFYFFHLAGSNGFRHLGFDLRRPGKDSLQGVGLFVLIGIGTLGIYALGRTWGVTTAIVPEALAPYWWTIPVLLLSAIRHGILEETIMIGYLFDRLRKLGWGTWPIILTSAVMRGSYHLYQGFGPFLGNAIMGVIFGWIYTRTGRVMPLVIAHALLDIAGFVGYSLIGSAIGLGT